MNVLLSRCRCPTRPRVSLRAVGTVIQSIVQWIGTPAPSSPHVNCLACGIRLILTEGLNATTAHLRFHRVRLFYFKYTVLWKTWFWLFSCSMICGLIFLYNVHWIDRLRHSISFITVLVSAFTSLHSFFFLLGLWTRINMSCSCI